MPNKCRNPECMKTIPNNMNYCSEDCLRRHIELKTQNREALTDKTVEEILEHIGVTQDNVRADAYNHWKRLIEFVKDNSPALWREEIRPKLRSWIGVDFRYIDDYLSACLAWGIIELKNGTIKFLGIKRRDTSLES